MITELEKALQRRQNREQVASVISGTYGTTAVIECDGRKVIVRKSGDEIEIDDGELIRFSDYENVIGLLEMLKVI